MPDLDDTHQVITDGVPDGQRRHWRARVGVPRKGDWLLHMEWRDAVRAKSDFRSEDVCIILYDPQPPLPEWHYNEEVGP